MYPKVIRNLIEDFQKLPGIGEKTAERLVLGLASDKNLEFIKKFSEDLIKLNIEIKECSMCNVLTDKDTCDICSDKSRNQETLLVVSDSKDVFSFERMKTYRGKYYVLGGLIDYSRGITEKDLKIESLLIKITDYKEIILATNSTVEGEMTAKYLKTILEKYNLKLTRLASGIPMGSDLKYADELTLHKALENRQKYD